MKPLLVVDGDSFAHRAYHALPAKAFRTSLGRPGNALTGFTNMLLRLWQEEQPRTVLVAWDRLDVPTYRHTAFAGYQGGRVFDDELVEQLDLLPELVASSGLAVAKHPGYEADDFLAAAAAREEAAGGASLVATSDRDAYQLVTERTTILQPVRGGGPPARIDPVGVRERYGVEPSQVPDFIALRGDPSDRIPGARGVGEKRAADLLAQYDTLDDILDAGRFEAEADVLRLFKHMATLDRGAPLPPLPDVLPDWTATAAYVRKLGLEGLATRLEAAAA